MSRIQDVKTELTAAGYAVSEGDTWTAEDSAVLRQYAYFNRTNVTGVIAQYSMAYPGLMEVESSEPGEEFVPVSWALTFTPESPVVGDTLALTATVTGTVGEAQETRPGTITAVESSAPEFVSVEGLVATAAAEGQSTLTVTISELPDTQTAPVTVAPVPVGGTDENEGASAMSFEAPIDNPFGNAEDGAGETAPEPVADTISEVRVKTATQTINEGQLIDVSASILGTGAEGAFESSAFITNVVSSDPTVVQVVDSQLLGVTPGVALVTVSVEGTDLTGTAEFEVVAVADEQE